MGHNIMNKKLTDHVSSILNISEGDASKWIEDDKVIRKWLKSESSAIDRSIIKTSAIIDKPIDVEMSKQSSISDKNNESINKRSTFLLDGKAVRLETVFSLWFDATGCLAKKETIQKFIDGKTKARKGLQGYLKSASIESVETFVLLFNVLILDKKLSLNGGAK